MAKPQIPVGSWKAAAHGIDGPCTWVNVFYGVVTAGSSTPGDVIAQVADFITKFYTVVFGMAAFSDAWALQWVTVSYRDATDSLVRVRVADAHAGTDPDASEAGQVAYLVNWSTGDPRRGGKPRQYVAGVPVDAMTNSSSIASGIVAARNAALITWLESGPTSPIPVQLVEMSFRDGNAWRTAAHTYPIIGGTLNPVVATQRRRVDRLRPS